MSELERLVVVLAQLLQAGGIALSAEALALAEVIDTRSESSRGYHLTRRGVHALERVAARVEKRDPDYAKADAAAGVTPRAGRDGIEGVDIRVAPFIHEPIGVINGKKRG